MRVRILDLDGSVAVQSQLVLATSADIVPLQDWGPRLRLACSFRRFRRFDALLNRCLLPDREPTATFYGSGDFHHVTLALLCRLKTPFNLLVLDKHPDWMCGIPFLHCGTWLRHAVRLPLLQHVFHVGGDLDFDNAWRWLAPVEELERGKITVFPAVRSFQRGPWRRIGNVPVRTGTSPVTEQRVEQLLRPFAATLGRWPLYVSLDKDAMTADEAIVNWDSGHLHLEEVTAVLDAFLKAARGDIAGLDVVGDWSPVNVGSFAQRLLHWTEHPPLAVDPADATLTNARANLALMQFQKQALAA